jgi:hypothetical protein
MVPCELAVAINPNMENETQRATACDARSMDLGGALKVIRRLNRNTTWVAMGLVGCVIFAALMVVLQERHPEAVDVSNAAPLPSEKRSHGEATSGQAASFDQPFTQSSPQEHPFLRMEAATLPKASKGVFNPGIKRHDVQANATSWSPARRRDSTNVRAPRTRSVRNRSTLAVGSVDVKRRLIKLWHQSMAQRAKSRSWAALRT